MNTPKGFVWELIRSLSPAEKRYFKIHFASDSNQLTRLFDLLNHQSEYQEEATRQELGVAASQFKVLKHQLQELILKSLLANNGKRSISSKVRLGIEEVDLLLEREHFSESIKRLRKLNELCAQYGLTLYQYEVRERLHHILHLELDFSDPAANRHYQHLLRLQRVLEQKQALSTIQLKLDDWNPFTPERHKVLVDLRDALMHMKAEYLDFETTVNWAQCMATCSELLGDDTTATQYRQQVLAVFVNLPNLKNDLPLSYLRALKLSASPARGMLAIKEVNKIADQARRVIGQYPQYSPHYIYFLWARLQTYYLHHQWDRIIAELENSCLEHLRNYDLGESRTALKIYIILMLTYLILNKPEQAYNYLKDYHLGKTSKDPSLDYTVNLLELILWVEYPNMSKLKARVNYLQRHTKSDEWDNFSPLYHWHLDLFAAIEKRPFDKQAIAAQALLQIADFPYDPILYFYSFFNIDRWLQSVAAKRKWKDTFMPA